MDKLKIIDRITKDPRVSKFNLSNLIDRFKLTKPSEKSATFEMEVDVYDSISFKGDFLPSELKLDDEMVSTYLDRVVIKPKITFPVNLSDLAFSDFYCLTDDELKLLSLIDNIGFQLTVQFNIISVDSMDFVKEDGSFGRSQLRLSDTYDSEVTGLTLKLKEHDEEMYAKVLEIVKDEGNEVLLEIERHILEQTAFEVKTVKQVKDLGGN